MLMVIVGAGASFGCRERFVEGRKRPPLTSNLFHPEHGGLLGDYGAARGLVSRLRRRLHGDDPEPLEELLEEFSEEAVGSPERRRELLALQMYMQKLMLAVTQDVQQMAGGDTLYDELVSSISEWSHRAGHDVAYVSFNYDLLLDDAIRNHYGLALETIDAYTVNRLKLIKPHGSADWHQIGTVEERSGNDVLAMAPDIRREGEVQVDRVPVAKTVASNMPVRVPVIALPMVGKANVAAPREHMATLGAMDSKVQGLLTIGWRGREPHLLPAIRKALAVDARLTVVDADVESAAATAEGLRQALGLRKSPVWKVDGFAGFLSPSEFRRTELDHFLRSMDERTSKAPIDASLG